METASLLNIKPKTRHSTDVITGQALAMVSADKNKTDGFKSAFKNQLDKKRNDVHSDKDLPQNGNELPKKKMATDKHDNTQQSNNNNEQAKNSEHENNTRQMDNAHAKERDSDKHHEQTNGADQVSHEQANSHEQKNSHEQANSHEQRNSHEQTNSLESVNNYGQIDNHESRSPETVNPQQLEEAIEYELVEKNNISEQTLQSELNDKLSDSSLLSPELAVSIINSDSIHSDKKIQTESIRGQFDINQPASNGNLISQMAANSGSGSGSGSESKNESALAKSIAEFQQFIEMSKKHSMAGESIASVKSFEQSMKNEQTTAQLLLNDIKLPASQLSGQTSQSAQVAMQSVSLDKVNSSLSFLQTTSSLEVKTAVGKSGWNQNFSNQIIMMANNGVQQAKIKLNPMALGPVEAMVRLSGDTAVVNLTSLHLSTKDALESAIPRLKEMLNENGFSQVDVDVSHQDKQQQEAALGNRDGSKTGSNNEHGNSTMPGDEQLSKETPESESDAQAADSEEQGLNIVDYYA